MRIFYERVSTEHQSLARQDELLKKLNIEKVFADKATGKHMESMHAKGITFESQKEKIDTSTASGKLFLTIIAALNEFEREVLLERQAEGIAVAKRNGKYKGRMHASIDKFLFTELYKEYKKRNITQKYMCKRLGISRSTLYKEIKKYELNNL